MGEVQTGLLRHSAPLSSREVYQLLDGIGPGATELAERPIAYARSSATLAGVDCAVEAGAGRRLRAVGTVEGRVSLIGNHVVQGVASTVLQRGQGSDRQPWPHYLSRPGVVELLGRFPSGDVVGDPLSVADSLALGAASNRLLGAAQSVSHLDRRPPLRTARGWLRWAHVEREGGTQVRFVLQADGIRTLEVRGAEAFDVRTFAADVALHDWLLTTLLDLVRRSPIGVLPPAEAVAQLQPAIEHLLHLWLPNARGGLAGREMWDGLDQLAGFGRQWSSLVQRVRDVLALAVVSATLPV
ncbi:hypothetical protein Acy02nite_88840 [Actinoplanes cyaneus]|uniref:Uncharacterized protein n=1 Tax=Actinoplanes cyaneus TaxID=52696 RepID=A0A919MAY2_9ACTN|nr:hypothetical protein Acy02nite_88840 [Actinoplanes cyaneus]